MRVWLLFLLLLCAPFTGFAAEKAPAQITFGFVPSENPDRLKQDLLEFAKLVQDKVRIPVTVQISKDYAGLIEAMKTKKVDFAFLPAMTFVFAEKAAGAKVLLKKVWDSPFYHSAIVVRADSGISKLEQLKDKRFAFVDEKSASGYLYPRVHIKKQGHAFPGFFKETVFSGNHPSSIALLRDKKIEGAAVFANDKAAKAGAWTKFKPNPGEGAAPKVKALWVSDPIPNDPLCVRQDFYDKYPRTAHDVMFGLIEMMDDASAGPRLKELLGVSGLMLATSQQYEPVREMVRELDLQLK